MRRVLIFVVLALTSACAARAQSVEEAAPPAWFETRSSAVAESDSPVPKLTDVPAPVDALRSDSEWRALFADFDVRRADALSDPRLPEDPDRLSPEAFVAYARERALRGIPNPPAAVR